MKTIIRFAENMTLYSALGLVVVVLGTLVGNFFGYTSRATHAYETYSMWVWITLIAAYVTWKTK